MPDGTSLQPGTGEMKLGGAVGECTLSKKGAKLRRAIYQQNRISPFSNWFSYTPTKYWPCPKGTGKNLNGGTSWSRGSHPEGADMTWFLLIAARPSDFSREAKNLYFIMASNTH